MTTENPYTTQADYNQGVHNAGVVGATPAEEFIARIRDTHAAIPELITPDGLNILATNDADTLADRLRAAAAAYYDGDTETMSDADYDQGIARLETLIAEHPHLAGQYSDLFTAVAAGQSAGGDVEHPTMMGSLDKATDLDAVREFVSRLSGPVVVEPKLDGLAIRARYDRGVLSLVATRGDGRTGEDITAAVKALNIQGLPQIANAPLTENGVPASFEVRGEVFVADIDFPRAQQVRESNGGKPFVNSRNAAAGILRKGDPTFASVLTFSGYDATFASMSTTGWTHGEVMDAIERSGITTARSLVADRAAIDLTTPEAVIEAINYFGDNRPTLGFPIDGAVIKATTPNDRVNFGMGSRAPRWAVAYKYAAETATTQVVAIHQTIGRTGRLAFQVEVQPVFVGGTTITYLSGHNVNWLVEKDIRVGDTVQVRRAGDVIPYIDHVVVAERPADALPWEPPATDPLGNEWDKSTLLWRSTSPELSTVGAITMAVGRDHLDVDGLGVEIATALVEQGLVNDVADLFALDAATLASLPLDGGRLVGAKVAAKVAAEIEKAKGASLNRIFSSLNLRMTGRTMGRRLAAAFPTMGALRAATVTDLANVDGIGEHKATVIRAGLDGLDERGVFERLAAAGVNQGTVATSAATDLPLAGLTVVVSGSVPGLTRTEIAEVIEANGGKASSSVSKATSLLVSEPSASSKYVKAVDLGVRIVTPVKFLAMIGR